jgi:hypothetical protein
MKHVLFATVAAFGLMAGAAMAQDVAYDVTAPPPHMPSPVPTGKATYSSTLVTGVDGSTWQTGTPGFYFASPSVIAIPPSNFAATAAQTPRKPVPDDKHPG